MIEQFDKVTVLCKANVYFDGRVVSHSVIFPDRTKKSLGIMQPGEYTFNTAVSELMEITAGTCRVRLKGEQDWKPYAAGTAFRVAGQSAFDIAVDAGVLEYICSFGE